MFYRMVLLLSFFASCSCAQDAPFKVQTIDGLCAASSDIAEGSLDSDLNKRQSRFYCDEAVISYLDDAHTHLLIDFAEKEAHHSPILGFDGILNKDDILNVENVYFYSSEPTKVSDGMCKLFYTGKKLTGIGCGAKVDETGRRTVAIVSFSSD